MTISYFISCLDSLISYNIYVYNENKIQNLNNTEERTIELETQQKVILRTNILHIRKNINMLISLSIKQLTGSNATNPLKWNNTKLQQLNTTNNFTMPTYEYRTTTFILNLIGVQNATFDFLKYFAARRKGYEGFFDASDCIKNHPDLFNRTFWISFFFYNCNHLSIRIIKG